MIGPYDTPHAFRTALEARLRNIAQSRSTDLRRLRRQVAFERLLARLFALDNPPWLLKGGYALELRFEDRARSTLDLGISVPAPERLRVLAEGNENTSCTYVVHDLLQQAAARDLRDGFQFLIGQPSREPTGATGGGTRCSVEARLAGRTFSRFHLDVGLGDAVFEQPDWIKGNALLAFAGIPAARVALCPVEQQFAEKIHAYTFPWRERDNTRSQLGYRNHRWLGQDLLRPWRRSLTFQSRLCTMRTDTWKPTGRDGDWACWMRSTANKKISRRKFIKGALITAAALTLGGGLISG